MLLLVTAILFTIIVALNIPCKESVIQKARGLTPITSVIQLISIILLPILLLIEIPLFIKAYLWIKKNKIPSESLEINSIVFIISFILFFFTIFILFTA